LGFVAHLLSSFPHELSQRRLNAHAETFIERTNSIAQIVGARRKSQARALTLSKRASATRPVQRRLDMRFLVLIILLLLILGALPTWPYSAGWGYYPSGIGLIILIILAIVLLRAV